MITEAYCSFEVAKLLKEKGFNEECLCSYDTNGEFFSLLENTIDWSYGCIDFNNVSQKDLSFYGIRSWENHVSAPTHQMALAWLREKGIRIYIEPCENGKGLLAFRCSIYVKVVYTFSFNYVTTDFETYEEAVEAALKYSLENLI